MRIITGKARGAKLKAPEGYDTRPTTEAAKEAIFSAIQFDLHDRRVLDLFGGTGQLALEALSRGAASAVITDTSREAVAIIKENAVHTKLMPDCRILSSEWREYLRMAKGREKFGLVFLDPPYAKGILDEVLAGILEAGILEDDAIIVCESDRDGVPEPLEGFTQKLHRFGKTCVSIYRRAQEDEA